MDRFRRLTSSDARRFFQSVMDYAADGGIVIVEATKAHRPRAVIISVERARAAGILPKTKDNK